MHPIVTKGGNLVNVVPNEVVIETLVRAKNVGAMLDAGKKTDRGSWRNTNLNIPGNSISNSWKV